MKDNTTVYIVLDKATGGPAMIPAGDYSESITTAEYYEHA
jgi:hypothetical protein